MQNLKKNGPRQVLIYLVKILLIAEAYFIFAKLGLQFAFLKGNFTLIWPPSGIALATILLMGYGAIPGLILGAFIASYSNSVPILFALMTAIGNPLAAIVSFFLIKRFTSFRPQLDTLSSVIFLLIFGALVGPLFSGTVGSAGILISGLGLWSNFLEFWSKWWLGDAMGIIIFAPFLLTWLSHSLPNFKWNKILEGNLIFGLVILLAYVVFGNQLNSEISYSLTYLIFPLAIWAALRIDSRGIATINLVAMSIAVWGTVHGFGPFINSTPQSGLIYISSTITVFITALILAGAIAERKTMENRLTQQSNHDYLTGLYNRFFFDEEIRRLNNSRQFPISVIMADVDHLKKVNDTLGHDQGDQVLKNIALLFNKVFRKEDIVAHLSGDEFAILLPNTNLPSLKKLLKRIYSEISLFNQAHPELPIHISFGYCCAQKNNKIEDCLIKADKLMYLEKQKKQMQE